MTRALNAEWAKLRTVNSTGWSLGLALVLMVGFGVLICANSSTSGCSGECDDVMAITLGGVYLAQFAVVALAVMVIGSEYGTGLIRVTFVADSRRRTVLAAKAATVAGAVLVVGLVASVLSYAIGAPLLEANGYTVAHGYADRSTADLLQAIGGTGLYLVALALLSFGLAALLRSTAAAISTVVALIFVPLIAASLLRGTASDRILQISPMTAGLAIQRTVENQPDAIPIDPWVGLGVIYLWAAAAMAAALWLVTRRDA
jgi:ABC-2 type transport system permease protein